MNFIKFSTLSFLLILKLPNFPALVENCGKTQHPLGLIQCGENTRSGDFPWLVGIFQRQMDKFLCNGHLISAKHVLTSESCIKHQVKELKVHLIFVISQHSMNSRDEHVKYANLKNIDIVTSKQNLSEIYLLTLKTSLDFSKTLQPICLNGNSCDETEKCSATLVRNLNLSHKVYVILKFFKGWLDS